ncbi:MAG: tyrosine-type recombinase/integrase [Burkholderiaceae bacterium]
MGRRPSVNTHLPERMRARVRGERTYYYYDTGGTPRREVALGTDYVLAVAEWARLHETAVEVKPTVAWAIGKYLASPQYADVGTGTQADYGYALTQIGKHFGTAPLDEVRPSHITLYIDKRSAHSKHRALREKAVFSMLFSWCMARDYCTANPVAAIKTKRLPGRRNIYIDDDKYNAVYQFAPQDLKDAIDLAYFTGQRPADVLKLTTLDIEGSELRLMQNKTERPMRIAITGDLAELLQRILTRKALHPIERAALLVDEKGKPMTKAKLRTRFETARNRAGLTGAQYQFRDLRRKAAAELNDDNGLDKAQALLGHKNRSTTEHYASGKPRKVTLLPRKSVPQKPFCGKAPEGKGNT